VSVLPTLEALCAAWGSRGCASRLGWDRRLGPFQVVVTLVSRRADCMRVRVMCEVSEWVSQKVEPKIMTAVRTARPVPRLATLVMI
jgi:hypothetical protein